MIFRGDPDRRFGRWGLDGLRGHCPAVDAFGGLPADLTAYHLSAGMRVPALLPDAFAMTSRTHPHGAPPSKMSNQTPEDNTLSLYFGQIAATLWLL